MGKHLIVARPFLLGPDCGTTFFYVHIVAPRQHSPWGGRFSYSVPHVAATFSPRLHSLSLHSLSLYSLSLPLSLFSFFSPPQPRSLSLKQVFFFDLILAVTISDVGCSSPRRVSRLHTMDNSQADPVRIQRLSLSNSPLPVSNEDD